MTTPISEAKGITAAYFSHKTEIFILFAVQQ
jgi:hypothetical protein